MCFVLQSVDKEVYGLYLSHFYVTSLNERQQFSLKCAIRMDWTTLMMEIVCFSETLISTHKSTPTTIQKNRHWNHCRRDNLKTYFKNTSLEAVRNLWKTIKCVMTVRLQIQRQSLWVSFIDILSSLSLSSGTALQKSHNLHNAWRALIMSITLLYVLRK
jgi:hypothetical protein